MGVKALYIEPGNPRDRRQSSREPESYIESSNGMLRDERLNGEIFHKLTEAKMLIERWRVHYNTVRPHSSLGDRPPAPEANEVAPPLAGIAPFAPLNTVRPATASTTGAGSVR